MSELSEQERKRIYEEEKTRLETQEGATTKKDSDPRKMLGAIAAIGIIVMIVMALTSPVPATTSHPPVAAAPQLDKTPAMQTSRQKLIQEVSAPGRNQLFTKVVRNGTTMPRAWVTPLFLSLNFDDKQKFISVVYAFYFDGTHATHSVAVIDTKTGKEIGRYGVGGLRLN